jgi:hypothetical protein
MERSASLRKWLLAGGAVVLILFAAAYLVVVTVVVPKAIVGARARSEAYLSKRFKSDVHFDAFHIAVLPEIHVEIDGIVLRHQGRTDIPPMIQIQKATFGADWLGLLGHKADIKLVRLDGLQVSLPPRAPGSAPMFQGTKNDDLADKYPIDIHEIQADNVNLVMLRRPQDSKTPPTTFEIHNLRLQNFTFDSPASFQALLTNPKPRGVIHTAGQFGPWQADDPSQTPVDGAYTFQDADMSRLKGLKGTMQSEGQFRGPLDYLEVDGETEIADFALRTSARPMPLHTDFSAIVDGTNGNTILKNVTAHLEHTIFSVHGEVVDLKKKVKGRTIELYTTSSNARIEDLLTLAVDTAPPALIGPANLNARIDIPEGDSDLIDRMSIDGHFAVGHMQFTNPAPQSKVDSLSRRAQGEPKNDGILDAPSELKGTFDLSNSQIRMSNLVFAVDGATIALAGTYQMDSGQLDFRGHLKMDAKLSQTTTGVKSLFLKVVDPFFSKHGVGTDLPIKITGTKDHPSYGLDLHDKDNTKE